MWSIKSPNFVAHHRIFENIFSYMAPEIILKIDYGKPADIWSMGILLFVLLHGKFPF